MVVDSSILIAILLVEPEADDYAQRLIETDEIYLSAVSVVESSMVIEYKKGEQGAKLYDELLKIIMPTICCL
jgi:ribonuclease VapC